MRHGQSSRTSLGAAGHRAAHQALEGGAIFADPLALRILGDDAEDAIALAKERPERRPLRLFIAMRSRFAEDAARRAIEAGVRQILVLGAGLDTFAYRLKPIEGLRVFEVDHPATQADKRRRLAEAQIGEPAHVAYVGNDFEHGRLTEALEAGGLDSGRRTFVLWLGVTPYLTEDAAFATLGELARLPGGVEVVFDYANPPHMIEDAAVRDLHQALAARVAASGEPFRYTLETKQLHARAHRMGLVDIEDLDRAALVARFIPGLRDGPRPGSGGHVVRMATSPVLPRFAGEDNPRPKPELTKLSCRRHRGVSAAPSLWLNCAGRLFAPAVLSTLETQTCSTHPRPAGVQPSRSARPCSARRPSPSSAA